MASIRSVTFVAVMACSGVAVAGLSWHGVDRKTRYPLSGLRYRAVAAQDLASWIIEGRRDFVAVDLRTDAEAATGSIRGAVRCAGCHDDAAQGRQAQADHFVDLSKKLVLITQTGGEDPELPRILSRNPNLHVLKGGFRAWEAGVLAAPVVSSVTDEGQARELRRRTAIRNYFLGLDEAAAQPAALPVTPIRRQNAHQPAVAREGC